MTDVPSNYEEIFPALDGQIINSTQFNSLNPQPTSAGSQIVNSNSKLINNINNNHVTNSWSASCQTVPPQPQTTLGAASATGQPPTTKLNYLLLQQQQQQQQQQQTNSQTQAIQQLYKQQQQQQSHLQHRQQQVLEHLVDSTSANTTTSSTLDHNQQQHSAMVSQYHQQPQQPLQPQQQNNNNNTVSSTTASMLNNAAHKRPGLPNPILSSERCATFKIAPEERRHRDFELEQSKILKEIMQKTNTKIEVTTTKDGALNFCIIGKEAFLQVAKNLVLNDFQTSVTLTVAVPKSIHGRLLGPKGLRLASIQDETQTKIAIPRKEDDSDIIKIVGLKNNAEQAVRSIQKYAREFAGKTIDKITVERVYLLFITGPFNENLKRWEEMGAKVSTSAGIFVPSQNQNNDGGNYAEDVTFTIQGETTVVSRVKDEISQIYEDKKKKCTTVNMEVKKAQHKYILGSNGQNLRQFFADTGVSVELPHESESETITLRGERSKLAPALSELYTQAHSETDDFFEVETWLHKYLIGPRKTNSIDFKSKGVEVKSLDDKIKLHGPPTEIENIKDSFETELNNLRKTIIQKNIQVEPRIHGYIIGKSGATVDQIREESGAHVLVPKNDEINKFITLEGTEGAVAIAEEKINAIAKKYEASKKLVIDQQLHGSIIGRGGEKIRSIREKFTQVAFTFPEQGSKNNEITIVGPAGEVEECYNYLDEFHKQLQENNHQVQVPIKKDIIKYIPDAQQAIRRIKVEHKVKVDIFINNNTDNNNSTKNTSPTAASTTANQSSTQANDGETDNKKKSGKNKNKNKQPQSQVNGVKPEAEGDVSSTTTGSKIQKDSYAVIIGKKEDVDQAKVKVSKLFEELATTIEVELKISSKLRSSLGPKTRLYKQVLDEFQNKIVISFAPQQTKQQDKDSGNKRAGGDVTVSNDKADANGVSSTSGGSNNRETDNKSKITNNEERIEVVKIRGPKNVAKKAEKRFETLVAECQEKIDKNFSAHVTVPTSTIEKFVYTDKMKLNKIKESQNVKLSIPDRRDLQQLKCVIIGYEKNVQAALKEFNKLVKDVEERVEESIEIASQALPRLIGAQGRTVKKLMEDYKINVKFARQGDPNPNLVVLSGRADNILAAKNHMMKLANQYLSSAAGRANSGNSANNNINNINNTSGNNNSTSNNNNNSQQSIASGDAE